MKDTDTVSRFFQFNKDKTAVTLIVSTESPMTFSEYLDILNDFVHENDIDGVDMFLDTSFLAGMN